MDTPPIIEEYTLAEEEVEQLSIINLLNIYICYFKQLHTYKQSDHMFINVDPSKEDSTNKCMEQLYEEIYKFSQSADSDKDILFAPNDIDIDASEELYILYIDSNPIYCSKYLIMILKYLGTLDWMNINFTIVPK